MTTSFSGTSWCPALEVVGTDLIFSTSGLSVGSAVATSHVCLIESAAEIDRFVDGAAEVLLESGHGHDLVEVHIRVELVGVVGSGFHLLLDGLDGAL